MFIFRFIQVVIIRLFLQNLIWKSFNRHHIHERPAILKKRKLISLEKQCITATGKDLFPTSMLTRKFVASINLFSTSWVTFFNMKPYYAMIRVPRGLTHRLKLFYRSKIKFSKNETNIQLLNKLSFFQEPLNVLITNSKNN